MARPFRVAGIPILSGLPTKSIFYEPIYVSSVLGSADNDGRNPRNPAATVAEVFSSNKVATNGSIVVGPGHSEDIIAAAGMVMDIAGVHVLGLGEGSARPTITFTTATGADIDIDAANITLENFILDCTGFDALTGPIDVNAAYFTMKGCDIETADGTNQAIDVLIADLGADNMLIKNNRFHGTTDANTNSQIQLNAPDAVKIADNVFIGDMAVANIEVLTGAATHMLIENNVMENFNGVDRCILVIANTTGTIRFNSMRIDGNTEVTAIEGTNTCALYENYLVNNGGESGLIAGVPST